MDLEDVGIAFVGAGFVLTSVFAAYVLMGEIPAGSDACNSPQEQTIAELDCQAAAIRMLQMSQSAPR